MGISADPQTAVDFPTIKANAAGSLCIMRQPRAGRESDWIASLLERYEAWRDLVDMRPAIRIEVERALLPFGKHVIGAARADAIVWHTEQSCSIIEAKTDPTPVAVAGAIGQLLYYRTLVQRYWNVKVDALLIASPTLPPFILESIADCQAPIRFFKRDADDNLSGLVPRYG